jgi:hypothetical protein
MQYILYIAKGWYRVPNMCLANVFLLLLHEYYGIQYISLLHIAKGPRGHELHLRDRKQVRASRRKCTTDPRKFFLR